jgi:hypothetical protein
VAGHFNIRTFGVGPEQLHQFGLDTLRPAFVAVEVYYPPAKESAVLDALSVILLIASIDSLSIPPVHMRWGLHVKRSEV